MLKVELNIGAKKVGSVEIVNVTRCLGRVSSDYYWRLQVQDIHGKQHTDTGLIVDSTNSNAMDLLAEVLSLWRSGDLPTDNHGQVVTRAEGWALTPAQYWEYYDKGNTQKNAKGKSRNSKA